MSIGERLNSLPYLEKWLVLGVILGIVAGLSSLTFYFAIKAMEYVFLTHLVGMSIPRPLGEGGEAWTSCSGRVGTT